MYTRELEYLANEGEGLNSMSRFWKKISCFILAMGILLVSVIPVTATSNKEAKKIRVGYMGYPGFIEKDEDGKFSGYGVEYLDEICEYTEWDIEYVYAPWYKQLEMLEQGEIDIVPLVQYTEERAERFLYTHQSVGIIQCMLLTLPEEQSKDIANNAQACDGKTIGIQRGSRNIELLERYADNMGFDYKKIEYDFQSELEEALFAGDVDIIACEQMIEATGLRVLDRFASDPYYFVTNKDNSGLMEEMDYAISKLNAYDPNYSAKLYQKYFGKGLKSLSPYFTKEEAEFIKSCSKVTMALLPDNKPDVYIEDGKLMGIFPDIMNRISELCGIEFSYTYIPQNQTPIDFLKENPNCLASGMLASNPAFGTEDVLLSDVFYTTYSVLATHSNHNSDCDPGKENCSIGTTTSFQAMHLFLQEHYPNLTINDYLSVEDGLKALEKRKVDYFSYNGNMIKLYLANPRFGDIFIVDNRFMINPRCIVGLNSHENEILLNIINKCIPMIGEEEIARLESEHMQHCMYHFNQNDVLGRYSEPLLMIALVVVGAFAVLVSLLLYRQFRYTRDITRHAEYDMVTGVYNRATLKAKVEHEFEVNAGKECAFFILDVDDLKHINDTKGNDVGDEAIKELANVLKSLFYSTAFVGRLGGDEFGVFLSGIESKTVLVSVLTRLQKAITMTMLADGTVMLRASIGVAMGIIGKIDMNELYICADEALHRVKQNGKNGFAFYESHATMSLNTIIQSDNGEYVEETRMKQSHDDKQPAMGSHEACDSDFRKMIDTFPNIALYVIERTTHKVLYFNRRFREICPTICLGMSCRNLMFGPCQNCIVDTMGEQAMAHTIFYSSFYGDEMEITATKIMWEDKIPAVMISLWPRNILSSSSDRLPSTTNQDTFDFVAGGLTRAGFIRMMERMQGGGVDLKEYALLFINIKDFKAVNEMVGNAGGDNLLRTVFTKVEQSKLCPIIGSRIESDHFIFMVEKNLLELSDLPELLNFHWQYDGKDLFIHCRCGIYMIEDDGVEIYKMLDRAKMAKQHIVDEYVQPYAVYNSTMLEEYSERASAFLLFDNGIKNREFVVYYQPIMDAKTEKVVSAEALVRRKTIDGSIISPGKFIPILERTGYISMLDRFVAESVGAFLNNRQNNGLPGVPISFNLSQKDFYDSNLMELLATSLENSKLPKGLVMLEITESTYTLHEKKHEEYLKRLREAGAKILLDDFGTGYSSFGMFKNYNFDRVKLDMSFVRQLTDNLNVRKVVHSIISMCHDLGVQIVAEGVETETELTILREMDCDYIQGYYFSKPLDEQSFVEYLSKHI